VSVQTGERSRDRRFERIAAEASLDLELVADGRPPDGSVAAIFGEILARAIGKAACDLSRSGLVGDLVPAQSS
jgi:hypothetical protein